MKLEHRLLLTGFATLALCASACVQGTVLQGGGGSQEGVGGDNGNPTGVGGTPVGTGVGGTVTTGGMGGRGTGGKTGAGGRTGAGGTIVAGVGGTIVSGVGGGMVGTCPTTAFAAICMPTCALVSDMEDGMNYYGNGCPKGAWYLDIGGGGTPTSGSVTPVAVTDRAGSTHAIHVMGSGQKNTTATSYDGHVTLSASLNSWPAPMGDAALNASSFTGIKFWGKVSGPIELHVPNVNTSPKGGVCSGSGATQCYDDAKMTLTPSTAWTQYMIPFAQLTGSTPPFGNPPGTPFPAGQIYSIEWHVTIPATGAVAAWDIWVDDLSFY